MKFSQLSQYFENIEATSSRLTITRLLGELFKKLNKEEIEKTIYLLQGRVAPIYEKIESGMAEKMIIRSILKALSLERKHFVSEYRKLGDLGKATEYFKKAKKSKKESNLTVTDVFENLHKLAVSGGAGSQQTKINLLSELIKKLDPLSCRYVVRIPAGIMRLGFSDMTLLDAFSWMEKGDKSLRPAIEKAYHVRPDLGYIGGIIKESGAGGLEKITPKVFTPILMMRAERLSSSKEILEKIGKCAVEPKYDGFRLQCHYLKSQKKVRLYSRNLEDVTFMYPDVVEGIKKEIKAEDAIIEGEAIGFNPATGEFLPFQETVQRKRKYGIEEKIKEIPLKLFAFELLYLNGRAYLNTSFAERRNKLAAIIKTTGDISRDTLLVAPDEIVDDDKKLELKFDEAISKGLEGIVAKKLDGIYQPGARGWNWIKFKRSYSTKIEDTIDCLVMGYDVGRGKRVGFGIGAFLAGVYDENADKFVTIAKIGTGLTDVEWKQLKMKSEKFKVQKKPSQYEVDRAMDCDIWLTSAIVVEIKADEITLSPVHTAGRKLKPSKSGSAFEVDIPGFALRFPRLQKFRDDKRSTDTTSLKEIKEMFKGQRKK